MSIPVIRWGATVERKDAGEFVSYHDYSMLYAQIETLRADMQRRIKLGKDAADEIDRLRAELDRLNADAVHSCGPDCMRPVCVLRRERDDLRAELKSRRQALGLMELSYEHEKRLRLSCETALEERDAELTEARRLIDEARTTLHGIATVTPKSWELPRSEFIDEFLPWAQSRARDAVEKMKAAPVPAQPAVPDDVAKDAWTFAYEPSTRFVGANHARGGKQSVCEVTNHLYGDVLGTRIAELLNTYGTGDAAIISATDTEVKK